VLGNRAAEHHNDWYEECQIVTDKKNKAYTIMQQRSYTRASVEDYQAVGRRKKGRSTQEERGNMRIINFKQYNN
jgi:hypothetical protein